MQDITHCHNDKPIYEIENSHLMEWDNPRQTSGKIKECNYPTYHPFIIDIETSAKLGQRPILLVGYNTLEDTLVVLYTHGYQDYTLTKNKVEKLAESIDPQRITLHNLSINNFVKFILNPIADWNKKARDRNDMNRISLVAHNAQFDIPMMGSPDDELLDNPRIGDQYEQAVSYAHVKMVGHRAGQFGQIYTFMDSSGSYETMHIPVGDTLVASQAIWIPGKLEEACERMGVDMDVSVAEEHGNLTDKYVKYCMNDVEATYELYKAISRRIQKMFGNLPIEHIYSTASIGKYVLRKMNYRRVGYSQEAVERIAPAYFGGRTDAEITGEIVSNVRYTDILSEYPTVSKLTNVWDFMKADYVTVSRIDPTQLPEVTDLKDKQTWKDIANYYVKIDPNGATLPVRTPHLEDTTKVVTSKVNSEEDLTYHYMDIISATLIDGKQKPRIKAAWKVNKHGKQNLKSYSIGDVTIRQSDNVMAKSIESRKELQKELGGKNEQTLSLKIVANSLYGVSAERIVKEIDDKKHDFASETGFYNPHVASTITAGGRLMLAFGEYTAKQNGGNMYYCDTDSLILDDSVTQSVIDAFNNLNPYDGYTGTLDVLEDEKGISGNLYAVGTKKYVFFDNEGNIKEYKEHGLGNYENLRGEDETGEHIVKRLWATILYYDKGEKILNNNVLYDGKLNESVLWSFTASTRSMRELVDKMTLDDIRYGDWLQSTLSIDNETRYIALNLMEKDADGTVIKVKTEGSNVTEISECTVSDMQDSEQLKTVKDVVMKFVQDTVVSDHRPEVNVTQLRVVTKEATNSMDLFEYKIQKAFEENAGRAIDMLMT